MKAMIVAEAERLMKLFADSPDEVTEIARGLIEESAFMKVTLETLKREITESGTTDEYQNGANQNGIKISASLQAYNSTIKNYVSVNKQIYNLLKETIKTEEDNDNLLKELGIQ